MVCLLQMWEYGHQRVILDREGAPQGATLHDEMFRGFHSTQEIDVLAWLELDLLVGVLLELFDCGVQVFEDLLSNGWHDGFYFYEWFKPACWFVAVWSPSVTGASGCVYTNPTVVNEVASTFTHLRVPPDMVLTCSLWVSMATSQHKARSVRDLCRTP